MSLVLAPTRELALQIYDEARKVYTYACTNTLVSSPKQWRDIYPCISPTFLLFFVVLLPVQSASLCRVWRSRHWPADQRSGERLPSPGGHPGTTGGHDGEGQDWTGLLQVRHGQEKGVMDLKLWSFFMD